MAFARYLAKMQFAKLCSIASVCNAQRNKIGVENVFITCLPVFATFNHLIPLFSESGCNTESDFCEICCKCHLQNAAYRENRVLWLRLHLSNYD